MNNEQNKWVPIAETKQYPAENETVWLYNEKDKSVMLGCHVAAIDKIEAMTGIVTELQRLKGGLI